MVLPSLTGEITVCMRHQGRTLRALGYQSPRFRIYRGGRMTPFDIAMAGGGMIARDRVLPSLTAEITVCPRHQAVPSALGCNRVVSEVLAEAV